MSTLKATLFLALFALSTAQFPCNGNGCGMQPINPCVGPACAPPIIRQPCVGVGCGVRPMPQPCVGVHCAPPMPMIQNPCVGIHCPPRPCIGTNCAPPMPVFQNPCVGLNCQQPMIPNFRPPCVGIGCGVQPMMRQPCVGVNCAPPMIAPQPCFGNNCNMRPSCLFGGFGCPPPRVQMGPQCIPCAGRTFINAPMNVPCC